MLNLFRISFKKTNECIILVVPLVIFLSVLSWYFNFARFSIDELNELIFAAVTLYVMFCGFLASWLYMAKKALAHSKKVFVFDKDKVKSLQKWQIVHARYECNSSLSFCLYGNIFCGKLFYFKICRRD